jgi:ABC-type transport system involved in cytochrome c biogenesis ATPase subunit
MSAGSARKIQWPSLAPPHCVPVTFDAAKLYSDTMCGSAFSTPNAAVHVCCVVFAHLAIEYWQFRQKSRVVFSIIAVARPNLLLLDEPTNHLDMECIDSLARAINNFQS